MVVTSAVLGYIAVFALLDFETTSGLGDISVYTIHQTDVLRCLDWIPVGRVE